MNYIKSLQEQVKTLKADKESAIQEIQAFRAFLLSDKFTGVDLDGGRKDWMSTSDISDRLIQIKDILDSPK